MANLIIYPAIEAASVKSLRTTWPRLSLCAKALFSQIGKLIQLAAPVPHHKSLLHRDRHQRPPTIRARRERVQVAVLRNMLDRHADVDHILVGSRPDSQSTRASAK